MFSFQTQFLEAKAQMSKQKKVPNTKSKCLQASLTSKNGLSKFLSSRPDADKAPF